MSRIGKIPVAIPDKVTVSIKDNRIEVKGPKGQLELSHHKAVNVAVDGKEVVVKPIDDSNTSRAMWGLTRTLVGNMVTGVTEGFRKDLEFNGVGYKAAVAGQKITLSLGYSHPIEFDLPKGIEAKVNKNIIELSGIDKELLGLTAAKIRSFRKPEPYKGKGVKYVTETIIRKAGKTGGKK
jgi:large subunit ribosomal protein L6